MRGAIRRLKAELGCIAGNIAGISAAVFLCAMGGILLWVNGGSGWYILRSANAGSISLTASFLVWLAVYALYGLRLACRGFLHINRRIAAAQCAVGLAYILDLVWYALFFCTRLHVLAFAVIAVSLALNIAAAAVSGRGLIIVKICDFSVVLCDLFYAGYTVMYTLLK